MTTYDKPTREFEICGVKYVETVAHFDNGNSMVALKRLSDYNLLTYVAMLQTKYGLGDAEIKKLNRLIDDDYSERKAEEDID